MNVFLFSLHKFLVVSVFPFDLLLFCANVRFRRQPKVRRLKLDYSNGARATDARLDSSRG